MLTGRLEAMIVRDRAPQPTRLSPWENSILKQITDMDDFTGQDRTCWTDYEKTFRSKAASMPSFPRSEWVHLLHSHVTLTALDYLKRKGLVVEDVLQPCTFEQYCAVMNGAMFGEALTTAGKINALLDVTQTGHFSDPMLFLRQKEKYLNQIPEKELGDVLRAACTLVGMNPVLQQQIQAHCKPRQDRAEVAFASFEEVRAAVVAVVSFQNDIYHNANKQKRAGDPFLFQDKRQDSYRRTSSSPNHQPFRRSGSPYPSSSHPDRTASPSSPGRDRDAGRGERDLPGPPKICVDCGGSGHYNKGFFQCPKFVPRAASPRADKPLASR